uniref:RRM domain-containing protein n=1 Tax=Romanomermis culicivorax TaxID=13658 RepID=A0A915IA38_ROMCU
MESNASVNENHLQNNHGPAMKSNKLFIRQLPKEIEWEEFEKYLQQYGEFINCEHAGNSDSPSAVITYKTNDEAHCAMEKLNGQDYKGQGLKVSISIDRAHRNNPRRTIPNRIINGNDLGGGGGSLGAPGGRPISSEMPLRMVVNAKYVGAIIGQGGSNIRQITKDSKARCVVDVSRGLRDQFGNVEKLINVYGPPDNASKACIKIMEIVQREMQDDPANQGKILELELKIRAHNNLVGRLIGKGGGTIKRIMEETGCTIFVSNIGEISPFNMERTITIKGGNLDKMSQAEQKISNKLRQCFENDIINAPHTMYGGMHPLMSFGGDAYTSTGPYTPVGILPHASAYAAGAMTPSAAAGIQSPSGAGLLPHGASNGGGGAGTLSAPSTPAPHHFPGGAGGFPHSMANNTEVVHIWVPNNIVGALIGTK